MKFINLTQILLSSISLFACSSNSPREHVICIKGIDISRPPSGVEAPDLLEITLASTDSKFNEVLDSSKIKQIVFWKDALDANNADYGSFIRLKKLNKSYYLLTYSTSYFIDYPVDKVQERGSDFMRTAQLKVTSKQGKEWVVKTCPQTQ